MERVSLKSQPMGKDDILELVVEDMGMQGEGIGRAKGVALFVKGAVVGDYARVKVMKMKKAYGYARLIEILEPSPYRVTPPCPVHRQCGGCQLQALDYEKQLEFKENKVRNNLKRIGGFEDVVLEPISGMENPLYYRNKAQFPIGRDRDGRIVAGFYASRSHRIVPNRNCLLGPDVSKKVLDVVIAFMENDGIPPYDENNHSGLVRHVLIRKGFVTGEIMVCLVINGRKLPHQDKLVEALSRIVGMTSISINVNKENTNVILGKEIILLWGKRYISDSIGGIQYQISPLSFYQVNPRMTEKLYQTVLEYAGLSSYVDSQIGNLNCGEAEELGGLENLHTVWDLYCGIGTISLFLAGKSKKVYGIEMVPQAIEDAKENARLNKIENVEFFLGKVEEVLPELSMEPADVVIVDPPRKGCDERCLETIVKMKAWRIVYVSCDSATLARDLRYLCDRGYKLVKGKVCDMFGMTVREECVMLLERGACLNLM